MPCMFGDTECPSCGAAQGTLDSQDEIDRWKAATMLSDSSGDPDGITPEILARHQAEMFAENDRLRAENERLRQAECGTCGRALPPDGDCYGCECDRLRAALAEWIRSWDDARYSKPGREGEWTRHMIRSLLATVRMQEEGKNHG